MQRLPVGGSETVSIAQRMPGNQSESWTYDQFNRVVTHVDMNGDTTWEVYENTPQLGNAIGDRGRLIAEYRYTGGFTPPDQSQGVRPYQTDWTERTVYLYDDGTTDPGVDSSAELYRMPSGEQLDLGRVAQVQEWVSNGDGTATETDFTDTAYDPVTGNSKGNSKGSLLIREYL